MPTEIMRQVPYEVTIFAGDNKSGKNVSNTLYYRDNTAGGYGATILGSSQATFTSNVLARWTNFILNIMSNHYILQRIRSRAIVGWKWGGPTSPWAGVSPAATTTAITTGLPHGLTTNDQVWLDGFIGPTVVSGSYGPITITGLNTFTIPQVLTAGIVVGGTVQLIQGTPDFVYDSNYEIADTSAGAKPNQAYALFASASVRRLNAGVGRNWKSRISLSPVSEGQVDNGRFDVAGLAEIQTAVDALNNFESGGGTAALYPMVVSRALAFVPPLEFTDSETWCQAVLDFVCQPNMGSIVSRKPNLTAAIAATPP